MKIFSYFMGFSALILLVISMSAMISNTKVFNPQKVRLSKLVIDSAQLVSYKELLKEEIEASMAIEPGVLTLYAVFEKNRPTHLTILEMYATEEAYASHVKTPHFLKYKDATLKMVKELELIDTEPLIPGLKIK
ncbi:putative quinol monooxygenase [Pedobacter psychrodurus]|uniref:putative quinol monooxygenase n=1 Tax=Pedobacter psychrodurus TaxID=2530456 RepID=UPI00292DCCED|nr:antibiotic biosynthesis monooxygenase [Pedobacter psychrodurus]